MKMKKVPKSLVVHKLENLSKLLFSRYSGFITELVGSSPGIYALYDGNELYYVGKSAALRKRVKQHLRDRHLASWTHFSLYLVRKADHIGEIESLLVKIANPKGNRITPKGSASTELLRKLKNLVKEEQKKEIKRMFGERKYRTRKQKLKSRPPKRIIQGLVKKNTPIYRTYKNKDYKAVLAKSGKIKLGKKVFNSPSAAALSIVGRKSVSGWTFWNIRDSKGEWVKLADYKG